MPDTSRTTLAAVLLFAVSPVLNAHATTIRVPADQPTVRAAAAAASSGDTVLVAPGVHPGGVWINGKALTFASGYALTGDTTLIAQTVVDGAPAGACNGAPGCVGTSVFEFGDNASGSSVVGLTVMHGENGVASASTVDIAHCRVLSNGDGMDYVAGSGGVIRNNLFANNSDDGIDINGRMNITIQDNDIRNNADDGIEYRLHAYTGVMKQVNIVGNRISRNGEDGIQLIDYPGASNYVIRIERNLFQANFDATGYSAAIGCTADGETIENLVGAPVVERVYVTNNTFIGEQNGIVGGANLIALNNLFTGISGTALRRVAGSSIASYCLFWGNGTDQSASVVDAPHLYYAAPQLDAAGRPSTSSPAIDAGTASYQWLGQTVLALPPGSYIGAAPDIGAYENGTNTPPVVNAGPDRTLTLTFDAVEVGPGSIPLVEQGAGPRADTRLDGSATDDGLPYPPTLAAVWSVVTGPGAVTFANAARMSTVASFTATGTYVLRLAVSDGLLSGVDVVTINVLAPLNFPPVVHAGVGQRITLPDDAPLHGSALDDGMPIPPGAVTVVWSKGSGPGAVTFQNPGALDTRAAFELPGFYLLRLTASDGALASTDSVLVTVLPRVNRAPAVDAGPDRSVTLTLDAVQIVSDDVLSSSGGGALRADASLDATATDDSLPAPAILSARWAVVSGPGPVTFSSPIQVNAVATFVVPGTYVLRLTVSDGLLSASDLVTITVLAPLNLRPVVDAGPAQTVILPAEVMLHGSVIDDGLPIPPGAVSVVWSMVSGPGAAAFQTPNLVDSRVSFPQPGSYLLRLTASDGALVANDSVMVTVLPVVNQPPRVNAGPDQIITLPADAVLAGTASDDGLPTSPGAVSVAWSMVSGPAAVTFQTPSLVVTRATFPQPGSYLLRLAASDGALAADDSMMVTVLPAVNQPPVVNAGPDQIVTLPAGAVLAGTASDDGLPSPPGAVSVVWSLVSGPGPVSFQAVDQLITHVAFTVTGTYVFRLTANDGAFSASAQTQVSVLPRLQLERRIALGSDDMEESANGKIVGDPSDLDLVWEGGNQTVGLRFTGIAVPRGAIVVGAYIQFKADAAQSEVTNLLIQGQATDDATTFGMIKRSISLRPGTSAAAVWTPAPWNLAGEAGPAQQTPELRALVQEIVDRPGWASGNAMAFIITGTGKRTARSQETDPAGAALLHIDYAVPATTLAASAAPGPAAAAASGEEAAGGTVPSAGSDAAGVTSARGTETAGTLAAMPSTPRLELALHGMSPQPAHDRLSIELTLADDRPAALELLDVAGRRVIVRALDGFGAGRHVVDLRERIPAGVYLVRLTQGPRAAVKKAVVLD